MFPTFENFFKAVHGHYPYTWQKEAAETTLRTGTLPGKASIPTGLGKTSMIDVAIYALAHQLHYNTVRTLPQRIVHAVERRIIVDQTSHHVATLTEAVNSGTSPELETVRTALLTLNPPNKQAISTAVLHGGKRNENTWMQATGATIVTSTVTQLVYRLMARSLVGSPRTAIIPAGLLGIDCGWIIDEPHLSDVAITTLRTIIDMQGERLKGAVQPQLCITGATVPAEVDNDVRGDIIRLGENETPEAKSKIHASRPARIEVAPTKNKKNTVTETIIEQSLAARTDSASVLVVVSTIARAISVAAGVGDHLHAVLTSRRRGVDAVDEMLQKGSITVATQTVEAGADIDADVLITDVCAWPALVQRMGRVNRRGTNAAARAVIVVAEATLEADHDEKATVTDDASYVYGEKFLRHVAQGLHRASDGGEKDISFSLADLPDTFTQVMGDAPVVPEPQRRARLTLDQARAALAGVPVDMDVWMRGPDVEAEDNQVTVIWREVIDPDVVELTDVYTEEGVSVSRHVAKTYVHAAKMPVHETDAGIADAQEKDFKEAGRVELFTILRGGKARSLHRSSEIRSGDILVAHVSAGGYCPARGLHMQSWDDAVTDVSVDAMKRAGMGKVVISDPDMKEIMGREDSSYSERRAELSQALGIDVSIMRNTDALIVYPRPAESIRESGDVVNLEDHCRQVAFQARKSISAAGVSDAMREQVEAAALYHDAGKALTEFQRMLSTRPGKGLLAKGISGETMTAEMAGCRGYRHEEASAVALHEGVFGTHTDLTVHLVASHHGNFRPESSPVGSRYVDLVDEYGPWGLGWLEAQLRLSDWVASRDKGEMVEAGLDFSSPALAEVCSRVAFGDRREEEGTALSGVTGQGQGTWLMSVAALAAATLVDPHARIYWDTPLVPRLLTSASRDDIDAQISEAFRQLPRLKEPLDGAEDKYGFAAKNCVLKVNDYERWVQSVAERAHSVTGLARTAVEQSWSDHGARDESGKFQQARILFPNNGNPLKRTIDAGYGENVLWDGEAGYPEVPSSLVGTDAYLDQTDAGQGLIARSKAMIYIYLGAAAIGHSLQRDKGVPLGAWQTSDKRVYLPIPQRGHTLDELRIATARASASVRHITSEVEVIDKARYVFNGKVEEGV